MNINGTSYNKLNIDDICNKLTGFAKNKKKLMIICHVNPDGDTVGSGFALKLIYKQLGGIAKCVCQSDSAPYLHFLYAGQETIEYKKGDDTRCDVICTVDTASKKQMGKLADIISHDKIDFMIDHHGSGEAYTDYLTDTEASACAEIIYRIYVRLIENGKINYSPDIARRLYSGISSDTGSFMYSNTTANTHMIAAGLVKEINSDKNGIDTAEITRILHQNCTLADLTAKKIAIENLKFTANRRIAYLVLTADILENNNLTEMDIGGIVDLPRSVEGVFVGVSIKQSRTDPESYRISSRSNCDINVAAVCEIFGGGGHIRAAGATVTAKSPEEAEKMIISAFSEAVNKYMTENRIK